MRFKETAEDIEVKERLWGATEREARHFMDRYAEEHIVGTRVSDGQEYVAEAAKRKGYPVTMIRDGGSLVRRGLDDELSDLLGSYRTKIGLDLSHVRAELARAGK